MAGGVSVALIISQHQDCEKKRNEVPVSRKELQSFIKQVKYTQNENLPVTNR
ncbi:hypothetical protein DESC_940074 [Desulfosarcina cetonica]|nr:hypothetical protein DESC_940074 [Desulfosarcina cetonica]